MQPESASLPQISRKAWITIASAALIVTVAMGVRLGVSPTAMSDLVGYDLERALATNEREVDRVFAAFGPDDPDQARITALRRALEALDRSARAGARGDDLLVVVDHSNALAIEALDRTDRLLLTADGTGALRLHHRLGVRGRSRQRQCSRTRTAAGRFGQSC